ncbi:hypothetical protein SDC9_165740 [bioreactor metagenome]|uniref:Uncharacterized protein n=1 Tax=bioreactor metagenome TaxID=1076179 RepID=A0A645FXK7_9ZZZZ
MNAAADAADVDHLPEICRKIDQAVELQYGLAPYAQIRACKAELSRRKELSRADAADLHARFANPGTQLGRRDLVRAHQRQLDAVIAEFACRNHGSPESSPDDKRGRKRIRTRNRYRNSHVSFLFRRYSRRT